jgi:hypothetical protein
MTASANAAAAGLMAEIMMVDNGFELGRNFGREIGICGEVLSSLPFGFSSTLLCYVAETSEAAPSSSSSCR